MTSVTLKKKVGNGVRLLSLEVDAGTEHDLPYKSSIAGSVCLLTVKGRPPLCLKCGQLGHFRSGCNSNARPSYADTVRRQAGHQESEPRDTPVAAATVEAEASEESTVDTQEDLFVAGSAPEVVTGMETQTLQDKRGRSSSSEESSEEEPTAEKKIRTEDQVGNWTPASPATPVESEESSFAPSKTEVRKKKREEKKLKEMQKAIKRQTGGEVNQSVVMALLSPMSREIDESLMAIEGCHK